MTLEIFEAVRISQRSEGRLGGATILVFASAWLGVREILQTLPYQSFRGAKIATLFKSASFT